MKKFAAVISTLFFFSFACYAKNLGNAAGGMPPGLQNKPHGLQMQNKTPHGWSQGKKVGWSKQNIKSNKKVHKKHKKNKLKKMKVNPNDFVN